MPLRKKNSILQSLLEPLKGKNEVFMSEGHMPFFGGSEGGRLLDRRLASGNLNLLNRRRRVLPRAPGGPARLKRRKSGQNKGTFGVGQGGP